MNVLHVSPTYYSDLSVIGGGERYVLYCAKALLSAAASGGVRGRATLVAFGDAPGWVDFPGDIRCEVVEGRPWDATSLNASQIRQTVRGHDVVIVHQCLSAFGLFLACQAKLEDKLVIGLDHGGGEHPIVARTPEAGAFFDLFQAYSTFGARAFSDIQGRVVVIPGPVDDEFYTPERGDAKRGSKVVALGRIMPHKGFDRVIAALPEGLQLDIVGRGYDDEYSSYLRTLASGKSVQFCADLDDEEVRSLLRQASIFVHASTHVDYRGTYYAKPELLGLAPLEALACGVPTLVSSAGSLPELACVDGCVCFGDDKELAALLRRHRNGEIAWPDPGAIHRDVSSRFGLAAYGTTLLQEIESVAK